MCNFTIMTESNEEEYALNNVDKNLKNTSIVLKKSNLHEAIIAVIRQSV